MILATHTDADDGSGYDDLVAFVNNPTNVDNIQEMQSFVDATIEVRSQPSYSQTGRRRPLSIPLSRHSQ